MIDRAQLNAKGPDTMKVSGPVCAALRIYTCLSRASISVTSVC